MLWFLAAREPVIGLTFIQNLDTSAAVIFGIPALCGAQSVLLMLSGHFAREQMGKAWPDRFPFATLAWVRTSRPHSTWLLLFLLYIFPMLTLVDLLVTMHGLNMVQFGDKAITGHLSGVALYSFPSGFGNGETWRWCVSGCDFGDAIPAIRRSAYPGLQPALYLLISAAVGVQTARFMVHRVRG